MEFQFDRFDQQFAKIQAATADVEGWLTPREIEFVSLLAAVPTAAGEILEIGSFRGKSTIALALGSELEHDSPRISVVDPFPAFGENETNSEAPTSRELFERNIGTAGVAERIEINQMLSGDLVEKWDRPLRLLWVDGDHTYEGANIDIQGFSPFLVDGGIIACHDILTPFGCTQSFKENIVENPHYGPIGFCGSIGWAKYNQDPAQAIPFAKAKQQLEQKLSRLCIGKSFETVSGVERMIYKFNRWFIPHGRVDRKDWVRAVA